MERIDVVPVKGKNDLGSVSKPVQIHPAAIQPQSMMSFFTTFLAMQFEDRRRSEEERRRREEQDRLQRIEEEKERRLEREEERRRNDFQLALLGTVSRRPSTASRSPEIQHFGIKPQEANQIESQRSSSTLNNNYRTIDLPGVLKVLEENGLKEYVENFQLYQVDGATLFNCTHESLETIGVKMHSTGQKYWDFLNTNPDSTELDIFLLAVCYVFTRFVHVILGYA